MECVVCGKQMGFFNGKVKIADGAVCNDCWNKTGIGTDMDALLSARQYSAKEINLRVNAKSQVKQVEKEFNPTKKISNLVAFDDNSQMIMVYTYKGFRKNTDYFKYSDIVSFDLLEDGENVSKGGLGRAVAGGLLFGGVGAIVGGVTGAKTTKNVCNSLQIKITLRNSYQQTVYIPFISMSTKTSSFEYKTAYKNAQETLSALQLACESSNSSANATPQTSSTNIEDIREYKKLLDDGIITEEEFNAKKKQLLGL